MKQITFRLISLLTLVGVLAVPFAGAEETSKEKPVGKRTLAKYDADKDGRLSEEEKAVWEADKAKAKAARKAKKEAQQSETPAESK